MFKNYLIIAFRNIWRRKVYSFINIVGLAVGIALFILIMLFVLNELRYDRFNENYERIYRIELNQTCVMPAGIGHILEGKIPEIEKIVRFYPSYGEDSLIKYDEKLFKLFNLTFADSTVFNVFTFPFIQGNPKTAIKNPFSLVLTESTAERIFGTRDPVGQTILLDNKWNFTITGIIKDVKNFHFSIDAVASFISLRDMWGEDALSQLDDNYVNATYFLLSEKHDASVVEQKVNRWLNTRHKFGENPEFKLRPLKGLYFVSEKLLGSHYHKHGNRQFIGILIIIGIFILSIASINFINLSISKASYRTKEVGIKKIVGASRKQLISQFLLESILTTGLALIFGFIIAEILVPTFNNISSSNLTISSFYKLPFPLFFIGGTIVLGIITGIYPALYFSAFVPNIVLKGAVTKGRKAGKLRRVLIVFQFSISIILTIATLTILKQLSFMKKADLGFKKEHILTLNNNRNLQSKKAVLRNELIKHPNIASVSFSCTVPGETMWNWDPRINERQASVNVNAIDPDFFQTYEIEMVEGRNFSWAIGSDRDNRFIVNEEALKFFEINSPIGQRVESVPNGNGIGEIIGVVKNFHFNSLHTKIYPVIFYWLDWPHNKVSVKILLYDSGASISDIGKIIGYIKEKWEKICPDYPFEYSFLDETFDKQYKSEERLSDIFISFALLAIFIACMGLFGLAAFTTKQRTKEIGVRKVLGASSSEIVFLLLKKFTKWVVVANIIAWPIAYYAMSRWLQNFAYRTNIGLLIFIVAAALALVIALITVSYHALKAAYANPIEALRYE
jgi:putative ABC transport system permease protein